MPTIYLVCTGAYDDYWPIAAFSDIRIAEAVLRDITEYARIEELQLDDPTMCDGIPRWLVRLTRAGNVIVTTRSCYPPDDPEKPLSTFINDEIWVTVPGATEADAEAEARRRALTK